MTRDVDSRLVGLLGLTGAGPALLAVAWPHAPWIEILVWTALAALVWVPVLVKRSAPRPYLSVTLVGVVAGIVTGILQGSLLPGGPLERVAIFVFGVVAGTVWGGLVALAWWGWDKTRSA